MNAFFKRFCFLFTGILFAQIGMASHVSGGDISYQCVGQDSFLITLNLFRDCDGISMSTSQTITFTSTCGGSATLSLTLQNPGGTEVSQLCPSQLPQSTCGTGTLPGMEHYIYTGIVYLNPPCDTWTMGWNTCCRNTTVNVPTSSSDDTYLQATMNSQTNGCNSSPTFTSQPIPYVCANQPVNYNYGVVEPDGDSLIFSLISGLESATLNLVYGAGYSAASPIPGITIDPQTGQLTFTPTTLGNFIVVVQVDEYDANGNLLGTTMRDIQFVVQTCTNNVPQGPAGGMSNVTGSGIQVDSNSVEMCVGDNVCFDVVFTDSDAGDSLFLSSNVDTVLPGATFTITGINPATATICWTAQPNSATFNSFTILAEDNACPVNGEITLAFDVSVIASTWVGLDITICGNQQANISATGGSLFTWSTISGDPIVIGTNFSCDSCSDPIATPSVTTIYEVVSDLSGTCVNRDTITVNVVPDFTLSVMNDTVLCDVAGIQLTSSALPAGTYTYSWTPAGTLSNPNIANPNAAPSSTTTYVLNAVSGPGCSKYDTVTVTVNDPIDLNISPGDTGLCGAVNLQIVAVVNSSALDDDFDPDVDFPLWTTNTGTASTDCGSVSGNALYFNNAGTREAATIDLNVANGGTIEFYLKIAQGSSAPCETADLGEDVVLEYSTNGGGVWTIINTYVNSGYPNFTYISEPIPAGAQSTATRFQWRQLSNSGTNFDNWALDDVNITGTAGSYGYAWSPSAGLSNPNIANPVASPTTTTTYSVAVTNLNNGCVVYDSITISIGTDFTYTATQSADSVCLLESVQFSVVPDSAGNYTYQWSPSVVFGNDSISNPIGLFDVGGTSNVYVLITSQTGCAKIDSFTVEVSNAYAPTVTTNNDTSICAGGNVQLSANVDSAASGGQCVVITECDPGSPDMLEIMNVSSGPVDVTGWTVAISDNYNDINIVNSQFQVLSGIMNPGDILYWEDNSASASYWGNNMFWNGGSNSWAIILDNTGAVVDFAVWEWPSASIQAMNTTINGFNVTIGAEWNGNGISASGSAMARQGNADNNDPSDWVIQAVTTNVQNPGLIVPFACGTVSSVFNYFWSPSVGLNNDTSQSPIASPTATTTYIVTVTDATGGCKDTASVTVNVTSVDAGPDTSACGGTIQLNALGTNPSCTGGSATYSWLPATGLSSTTIANPVASVTDTTTYIVTYNDGCGCTTTDTVTIFLNSALTSPDFTIIEANCNTADGSITVNATGGTTPYNYSIDSGITFQTDSTFTGLSAGAYDIVIQDALGCSGDTTATVNNTSSLIDSIDIAAADIAICDGQSTSLTTSVFGGSGTYFYSWQSTNELSDTTAGNPTASPQNTTVFYVTVTDNCGSPSVVDSITISVNPLPTANFAADTFFGCPPLLVNLINNSTTNNACLWYADGQFIGSNCDTLVHQFDSEGAFDVSLTVVSSDGCKDSLTQYNYINIYPQPEALFAASPQPTTVLNTTIEFTDMTTNGPMLWNWDFAGLGESVKQHPGFQFPYETAGTYPIKLEVENGYNCKGEITIDIIIDEHFTVYMPNAFTPNGDGFNDEFIPKGISISEKDYLLIIFDRWGDKIYETERSFKGWDGTVGGSGKVAAEGTYVWKLIVREKGDIEPMHTYIGHVNLIR